jgi:lysyl-tRNA synthetase, class II
MRMDELGFERLSMNFAAWGRLFYEDIHYTLPQRIAKQLLELINPFYQIKSLKAFNQRFYPEWVPRIIVYDDVRALPRVGLLFGGVEGFLGIPIIGKYLVPRTVPHVKSSR